ncbi:MAG TPA: DUF983 domain-containing protein [Alphaproteobacteria bacterium]|nr:DUF983 domain-containing protein [Alphaproteobacteria bacterium]
MSGDCPSVSPLKAGLACACPRCGRGGLFEGFLSVVDRCSVCGLPLKENDSGDGPAVFLIFILGFVAVPLAFWIDAAFDVPYWTPGLVSGIVVIALACALLRPMKAYVLALQYRHRRGDFEAGP